VLHTDAKRFGKKAKTLTKALKAIKTAVRDDGTEEINLRKDGEINMYSFTFGDVSVKMVAGFGVLPSEWELKTNAERNNATSIVVRLEYQNKLILFCGDAVGRHIDDSENALIATEQFMVDHASARTIDSDVLIAPHHGADNGSSKDFIEAVTPKYVIFSAGHDYEHPRASAANRYLAESIPVTRKPL
jgi:beta-lactamase superfamily II metal-dependent hydrolase